MDVRLNSDVTQVAAQQQTRPEKQAPVAPKIKSSEKDSFAHAEEVNSGVYDSKGKVQEPGEKVHTAQVTLHQIRSQIQDQVENYLSRLIDGGSNDKLVGQAQSDLKNYFQENPDALDEIAQGRIPEYWNAANTATRLFNILLAGYNESISRETFYEKAMALTDQAYGEVHTLIGHDFPDLVLKTRSVLEDALKQFKDGADPSQIVFGTE